MKKISYKFLLAIINFLRDIGVLKQKQLFPIDDLKPRKTDEEVF